MKPLKGSKRGKEGDRQGREISANDKKLRVNLRLGLPSYLREMKKESIVSLIDKIAEMFAIRRISADNGGRFNIKIALAWLSRAVGIGGSVPFRLTDFVDGTACRAFQSEHDSQNDATRRQRWARPVRSSCKLYADARLF